MTGTIEHQSETRWLRCQLDQGMFSNEMAVTYPPEGTLRKSVFVPETEVQGDPGTSGKVHVSIVRRGNKIFALLPSSQKEIVEVELSDLSEEKY